VKMTVQYSHNCLYDKIMVSLVSELDTGSHSTSVEDRERHMSGNGSRNSVWYISVHICLCLTFLIYYEFHNLIFKELDFYYFLPEQRVS